METERAQAGKLVQSYSEIGRINVLGLPEVVVDVAIPGRCFQGDGCKMRGHQGMSGGVAYRSHVGRAQCPVGSFEVGFAETVQSFGAEILGCPTKLKECIAIRKVVDDGVNDFER